MEVLVALNLHQMMAVKDILLILKNQPFQVQHGFSTFLIMEQGQGEATVEGGDIGLVRRATEVMGVMEEKEVRGYTSL